MLGLPVECCRKHKKTYQQGTPDEQEAVLPDSPTTLCPAGLLDATLTHAMHFVKDAVPKSLDPLSMCPCGR